MKTKLTLIAGLAIALVAAAVTANSQSLEPAVKIIPSAQDGIFKVIYGYESEQAVQVKFFNEQGLLKLDKIKAEKFENGFVKKYDVRNVTAGDFWIEVASANLTVTYKMAEQKNRAYQPILESTTYNNALASLNN